MLVKPDAGAHGLAGRIVARFEDAALKIVGTKMRHLDAELRASTTFDLKERLGADIYNTTATFMQSGPVVALALEAWTRLPKGAKIIGGTYPDRALGHRARRPCAPNGVV